MKLKTLTWEDIGEMSPTPLDFMTHLNYISCMKELSENLNIKSNLNIISKSSYKKECLDKKLRLIFLIKESLDEEYKKATGEKDFAKICSIWMPVKAYYLLFNLLIILHSLISDSETSLNITHIKSIKIFRDFLAEKDIAFSKDEFNIVSSCEDAISFNSASGDTLKRDVEDNIRAKSILKKLCRYKLEDFQRSENIKNFRKKKDREKKKAFLESNFISLFEFFYWYRIKTNYRDLAFLDQEIDEKDIIKFYENYYSLTINFYDALKELINDISKKRFNESIID